MGPWGALIMGFFGSVFFTAAIIMQGGWKNPFLLIPVLAFGTITAVSYRLIAHAPPGQFEPSARASKIISRSSIAEGVGIPVVILILSNTGHADLVLPGIALVVGLHFLPMAYAIPFRPYYAPAFLLLLAAAAGMWLPQPGGSILSGIMAGSSLWLAAFTALTRKPATPA